MPPISTSVFPSRRELAVRRAESQLKRLGFSPGKVDGVASAALTKAVQEFQTAWGLAASGELDEATSLKLTSTADRVKKHGRDLYVSVGQKSKDIAVLERRLTRLGYTPGRADGIFGRDTAEAVKAFRADQSELKDGPGALSRKARQSLRREVGALSHPPERRRLAPSKAQTRLDRSTAQKAIAGFGEGEQGAHVKNLQKHLRAAGFDAKHAGGRFDERTTGALKAFQRRSNLEPTGTVNARTWKALQKSFILTHSKASPAQALHERSGAVKASEKLLKQLGFNPGKIDGLFDRSTLKAVKAYEKQQHAKVDGVIGAGQLEQMKKLTKGVTLGQLHRIMPSLPMSKARTYLPLLNRAMAEAKINTKPRKAMFLAQLAHESVSLRYFEEIASGAAYEGRTDLGNIHPGDGVRYKGRGPIQLTGRSNYRAAGRALGLPLERKPKMAAQPSVGFRTAAWFWSSRGLNRYADRGDFREVTRRINGGYNGLADRLAYYRRALSVL
ncbi:MAG: peptidoglycan-binding protein [Archangium sp.]|nr:peptidoglycan-binding protein [Archangium sp.]